MVRQVPFTYLVGIGNWTLFSGLSYRGVPPSPARVERDLEHWLLWVANKARVSSDRLVSIGRSENGETFGRIHGHTLIELDEQTLRKFFLLKKGFREVIKMGGKYVPAAARAWSHGMSFFRLVQGCHDPVVNGYLEKQDQKRARNYEIIKTASATRTVISKALLRRAMCAMKRVTVATGTGAPAETTLGQFNASSPRV